MIETLEIRNHLRPYARHSLAPDIYKLTGEIIPNPRWVGPDKIAMMVDDKYIPLRIIDKSNIVGKFRGETQEPKKNTPVFKTWEIKGSKNNTYTITRDVGVFRCTCIGFQFRNNCKHINQAKSFAA